MQKNIKTLFNNLSKDKVLLLVGSLIGLVIIIVVFVTVLSSSHSARSESYKKVTGSAGLEATITYDCKKQPCFNFNVYILNNDGQQVAVVQPDKDGKVNMALPEGKYVMLIGKRFGNDSVFPEESVVLKNGQSLELKLQY